MTSARRPRRTPRLPSGIVGTIRLSLASFCRMASVGSFGSRIAPQEVHATDSVWRKARSSTAAPQFLQLNPRVPLTAVRLSKVLTLRRARASYSTNRPMNSSGRGSL